MSTSITLPPGSSTTVASPWPTGRKVIRTSRCSPRPIQVEATLVAITRAATMATRRSARVSGRAESASAPRRKLSDSRGVGGGMSRDAAGNAALASANHTRASAAQPASQSTGAARRSSRQPRRPPAKERGTRQNDESGAAGTLARSPISDTRWKCHATSGAVPRVAAALANTTSAPLLTHPGPAASRAANMARSTG